MSVKTNQNVVIFKPSSTSIAYGRQYYCVVLQWRYIYKPSENYRHLQGKQL